MRYLLLGRNDVKPDDRKILYRLFQKCLHLKDIQQYEENIILNQTVYNADKCKITLKSCKSELLNGLYVTEAI